MKDLTPTEVGLQPDEEIFPYSDEARIPTSGSHYDRDDLRTAMKVSITQKWVSTGRRTIFLTAMKDLSFLQSGSQPDEEALPYSDERSQSHREWVSQPDEDDLPYSDGVSITQKWVSA
jgi:hypothetical protein